MCLLADVGHVPRQRFEWTGAQQQRCGCKGSSKGDDVISSSKPPPWYLSSRTGTPVVPASPHHHSNWRRDACTGCSPRPVALSLSSALI
jgi:hypothetical protein